MKAFIDESGDEGTAGKGSRWLVLSCVMVADADVAAVKQQAEAACMMAGRGQRKWLHFKHLNHDDRRGAISMFAGAPWWGTIVASDTTKLTPTTYLRQPRYQFNYAARYVVERVSKMAEALGEPASVYFEARRNFDLVGFRRYIGKLLSNGEPRLNPEWISPQRIYQMAKGIDETLCIADGLANAAYKALEPHRVWGHYETAYLELFKPMLWKGPTGAENIHEWGFILMPTSLWDSFVKEYPWVLDLDK